MQQVRIPSGIAMDTLLPSYYWLLRAAQARTNELSGTHQSSQNGATPIFVPFFDTHTKWAEQEVLGLMQVGNIFLNRRIFYFQ